MGRTGISNRVRVRYMRKPSAWPLPAGREFGPRKERASEPVNLPVNHLGDRPGGQTPPLVREYRIINFRVKFHFA